MGNEYILPLSAAGGFAITAALFAFIYYRGLALIYLFERENYNTERFFIGIIKKHAFDKRATLVILVSYIVWYLVKDFNPVLFNPIFYILVFTALMIGAMSSYAVKKSVGVTIGTSAKAGRVHFVYMALTAAYFASVFSQQTGVNIPALTLAFLVFFQSPPLFIAAANLILKPWEEYTRKRARTQAKLKLNKFSPMVIGISGSYGKTTTKHILTHILSAGNPALATPDTIKTRQDLCDVIRHDLKDRHRFFVVEMESSEKGSVKKLAQLAPPGLGIITGVDKANLKRFKTPERAFLAHFELAEVLSARGEKIILNTDATPENLLKSFLMNSPNAIFCGRKNSALDIYLVLKKCTQGNTGLNISAELNQKGKREALELTAPLYGQHNCSNVLLAVTAALELGQTFDAIKRALKTVPQVPHRLEVVRGVKGPTIIDDSYEANPRGFASALQVLSDIKKAVGRRILVTPGMTGLGASHDAEHKRLGQLAGKHVDIALVITPKRMKTFTTAFNSAKATGAQLRTFDTLHDADDWIRYNADNNDVILYEGSLPGLYQTRIEF